MAVLKGIEELEEKLKDIQLSVQRKVLMQSLKEAAEITRARAAETAPILTGRLRAHEIVTTVPSESTAQVAVVRVGPDIKAFYGLFDEIGTSRQTPKPWLEPAFEETKEAVLAFVSEAFRAAIKEIT